MNYGQARIKQLFLKATSQSEWSVHRIKILDMQKNTKERCYA